jgi:AbrB family looped-hinge helix DNA binding protein
MRMGERGQVTVPKKLRDRFGLKPRDEIDFLESGGELVLRKQRAPEGEHGIRRWIGRIGRMPESVDEFIDDLRGR